MGGGVSQNLTLHIKKGARPIKKILRWGGGGKALIISASYVIYLSSLKVKKFATHWKMVKNPPTGKVFSSNPIDFDFNRYSLLLDSFECIQRWKKSFELWKKNLKQEKMCWWRSYFFWFFQIQSIHFSTFENIQEPVKIKKCRLKSKLVWFGTKTLLAEHFPAGGEL